MAAFSRRTLRAAAALTALGALAGCGDFDLRDRAGQPLDTSAAVERPTAERPDPDARGVIRYAQFEVAVAREGDTVETLAARIGVDARALAAHNGLTPQSRLRAGEVLVLAPGTRARVAGAADTAGGGDGIDITTLAGDAIDRAAASGRGTGASAPPAAPSGPEPLRHKVVRGETAYSIARLYGVSVRSLAEWNGLGADLSVREGQILLIPVPVAGAAARPAPAETETATTPPGAGSPTPVPPSAAAPLPPEDTRPATTPAQPVTEPMAEERTAASSTGRLVMPVQGSIIRGYAKGSNEGIDIGAPAGTPVRAAGSGVVAAITRDTEQVPILVIRHSGNLLTVYANIDSITVQKGDRVSRGQQIAKVRAGDPPFLHFEVREGFDSVDPVDYLE